MSRGDKDCAIADRAVVLIVEQAMEAYAPLIGVLTEAGFTVLACHSAREMRNIVARQDVALMILAHQLPGVDQTILLREVVDTHHVPTIILAEKSKSVHRILALEMGADDFITNPCELEEILARVRAVLRRTSQQSKIKPATIAPLQQADDTFVFDGLSFDLGRRELRTSSGALIDLTSAEIDLLGAFVVKPQIPLSRMTLIERMGKSAEPASIRTIDVLISKLRRKIEASADQPELIKTVRGSGYVFTPRSLAR
jgi:two-component system, OmpR family, response regulator